MWLLKWCAVLAVWGGTAMFITLLYFIHDLPDISKLGEVHKVRKVIITSESGEVLANFGDLYGEYVPYERMPKHLIEAVVATEDRRFFSHFGVDPLGILRAIYVNRQAGRTVQGGSTITQQLAKIVFLSPERKLKRKVQEALLALQLERKYTKEQILTIYLNRVYMGAGIYGVDAAAKYYFGKRLENISLYEAAMIAGLLKAPSRYAPTNNSERSERRTHQILLNMVDAGFIEEKDMEKAKQYVAVLETSAMGSLKNPYFADWVMEQIPDYIGDTESDITVKTTLNPTLQRQAEVALQEVLNRDGAKLKASQGAVVVMTPEGKVVAMVGGRDYAKSAFNRATRALRQPGSAFKLFVYLTAFKEGITPNDDVMDGPISIRNWQPKNYDNRYHGMMSVREAFYRSINTVAVQLSERVGRNKVIATAHDLGIVSPLSSHPSIALGSVEVNLLEMTSSYATVANEGNAVWPYSILSIQTLQGKTLYERQPSDPTQVVPPSPLRAINEVLMLAVNQGTGRAAQLDRPAAGKTGTTSDFRDAWFIGFTGDLVAGVWVGNDDNSPMKHVTGGGLPAQIWKRVMTEAHAGLPSRNLRGLEGSWWSPESSTGAGYPSEDHGEPTDSNGNTKEGGFWDRLLDSIDAEGKVEYTYPEAPKH